MTVTSLVFNSYDNCMCPYLRFARIYFLDFDTTSQSYIVNNNMIYLSPFKDALRLGIPLWRLATTYIVAKFIYNIVVRVEEISDVEFQDILRNRNLSFESRCAPNGPRKGRNVKDERFLLNSF